MAAALDDHGLRTARASRVAGEALAGACGTIAVASS
jgi:hypothetical protein